MILCIYIYIIILEEIEYGRIQNMQLKWEYDWKRTYSISCRIINICCIYIYISYIRKKNEHVLIWDKTILRTIFCFFL